ncbi:hypothetical protein AB1Y20_017687 [Prymnesium parvum]|uniref:Uncharacterized protein n=1 Tax=Prymnesium parvum TaxID=97485 RepID=A0AB34JPN1_PRYPA
MLSAHETDVEHELKLWVQSKVEDEVSRVVGLGQKVIKLPVKNCAVVRQVKDVVNRLEVDTGFNFDTVVQILLSDPVPCPPEVKDGYALRFVVLSTGKPMLLLLPYLYDTSMVGNTLTEWEFINNALASSRHKVDHFEDVDGRR